MKKISLQKTTQLRKKRLIAFSVLLVLRSYNAVIVYYDSMDWIKGNSPVALFDCNNDHLIDSDDFIKFYDML